jgi:dynein heavy chain, axonemal
MEGKPEFEDFCKLIDYYNTLKDKINVEIWGVLSMGFFEFHRTGLIDTMESLAVYMKNQLIIRMTTDQQKGAIKLSNEYNVISTKVLTVPNDTIELIDLKTYAAVTEDKTIPEMEDKLRTVRFCSPKDN